MSIENILILSILAGAIILFVSEKLRVDVVAMIVLAALVLTGLVNIEEAFSGFASPAVITVWAVFMISGGLTRSGVADSIARFIVQIAGKNSARLTVIIMIGVGFMSAFMNNIGAVAILLPAVVSVARETNTAPSKLLIPLAWASLLGGNMTMIGTPPNILASGILETYGGLEPFKFFDFMPMGIAVLMVGTFYMLFIGRHLLPENSTGNVLTQNYQIQEYLTELRVLSGSPLIGKTVKEADLDNRYGLNVIHIHLCCQDSETASPTSEHRLEAGDELHVEGNPDSIIEAKQTLKLQAVPDRDIKSWDQDPSRQAYELAEITLAPNSQLSGKTFREIDFRSRFGLSVLALRHHNQTFFSRLGDVPLSFGDSLLVQGSAEQINKIRLSRNFLLLDMPRPETRQLSKAPVAIAILIGILLAISTGLLHVSIAMFIGALLMVLTGTLTMEQAYQSIEWKSVFLIAGMLPLGLAMENTGTAQLLANQIINLIGGWGELAVLMGIFVMTGLLTEVMSNAAATVLAVPIAIDAALSMGANPHAFVMAIVIAASTSFLMPIGHQVNVLVYGPGGYQFFDYTKVGIWLNLILMLLTALLLPIFWPL
ncbi:MAG: SLC13 family permease [Anaerolineales bacterium]|nr:SLC13 family permease [Anaerolineales bacterium]